MPFEDLLGFLLSVLLAAYLVHALVRAEKY